MVSIDPSRLTTPVSTQRQPAQDASNYLLFWRQKKLLVRSIKMAHGSCPMLLKDEQWLIDCLRHSPVQAVSLDPELSSGTLQCWANACLEAKRRVFLRLPSISRQPKRQKPLKWWLKRTIDFSLASLLLLFFSPVLLALAGLLQLCSLQSAFTRQICVGERGRLFHRIEFNIPQQVAASQSEKRNLKGIAAVLSICFSNHLFRKLPELFNVLNGEMSLVGPYALPLVDALGLKPDLQKSLNTLPGLIDVWRLEMKSQPVDAFVSSQCALQYVNGWSIRKDVKVLLSAMPKAFGWSYRNVV